MLLVVDTNVLISAAIARGHTLDLIYSNRLNLITPEFSKVELLKHSKEIAQKAELTEQELRTLFETLFRRIEVASNEEYTNLKQQAIGLTPDPNDWPFFALALKEKTSIWSNDSRLKNQKQIPVLDTAELTRLIGFPRSP